jgi:hypothetical protein
MYSFARHIRKALVARNITVTLPKISEFEHNPTITLDCFLDDVEDALGNRKLVVLIDEFEELEGLVKNGKLDSNIFVYLRSLMQHRQHMNFLLAGLHTIQELTAPYWSVFFNIAKHRYISKLSEDAASRLIIEPVEGKLEYDLFAIEKIRALSGDQPYLIQLICNTLVQHCNRQQRNYVTINDVNVILKSVTSTSSTHFQWIWDQASAEERILLSIIAQEGGEEGHYISLVDIERLYLDSALPFKRERVLQGLHNLRDGDIVHEVAREHRYKVPVGLIRAWLREEKPLNKVIGTTNLLKLGS